MLFKGQIRHDEAVNTDLLAGAQEPLRAVGEHHIGVGREHQGDGDLGPQSLHKIKYLVGSDACFQCPDVGLLDGSIHSGGVREGNIQLNDVSTVFCGSQDSLFRGGQVGVTAGDETDVSFALCKGILELIHEYPPLCSGRWRRSPCRRGRRR